MESHPPPTETGGNPPLVLPMILAPGRTFDSNLYTVGNWVFIYPRDGLPYSLPHPSTPGHPQISLRCATLVSHEIRTKPWSFQLTNITFGFSPVLWSQPRTAHHRYLPHLGICR